MSPSNRISDNVGKLFAGSQAYLRFHQVHTSNHFGDRMLHLDSRVHLDEINGSIFVHQEFHRARAAVTHLFERRRYASPELGALLIVQRRRWRFLDQFLVPALDAALPLAQVHHAAMFVP